MTRIFADNAKKQNLYVMRISSYILGYSPFPSFYPSALANGWHDNHIYRVLAQNIKTVFYSRFAAIRHFY
jgi:hypothetical protein